MGRRPGIISRGERVVVFATTTITTITITVAAYTIGIRAASVMVPAGRPATRPLLVRRSLGPARLLRGVRELSPFVFIDGILVSDLESLVSIDDRHFSPIFPIKVLYIFITL